MALSRSVPNYQNLPEGLFKEIPLTSFPKPELFALNTSLAERLGFEFSSSGFQAGQVFSGGQTLHGHGPIAMAYSGHQFGHYAPLLGDGRAMLIGEASDSNGQLYELHLKGSGLTPFSRGGDGKATLGSAIREYVVSEAMEKLGVPTSRSLAIVSTGENVRRQAYHPGAVLTRAARSHLRVGTFQYAAANHDTEILRTLADFAIERLDPDLAKLGDERFTAFLTRVADRQARLIAKWMSFGFIHGVMNTDNTTLSGETIDYGPCAFMDVFHPAKVFSSIDHYGRYAWNRQPEIGLWNLSRLAEAFLPLLPGDEDMQVQAAEQALKPYPEVFRTTWIHLAVQKLGLPEGKDHSEFINQTLALLSDGKADFTRFFTALTRYVEHADTASITAEFETADPVVVWLDQWRTRTGGVKALSMEQRAAMRSANPVRIARNHQVEAALVAAEAGNKDPFLALLAALEHPFSEASDYADYEAAPTEFETVTETFCGT